MTACLLPTICPACGTLSFDGTVCTCPPAESEDVLLAAMLETVLPVELVARNLRDVVRAEGVESVRTQIAELVEALSKDLLAECVSTETHKHVTIDYVRTAVRGHITKVTAVSGGAEA